MKTAVALLLVCLWAAPASAQIANIVACWSLDETSDGMSGAVTRNDSSANALHLTDGSAGLPSITGQISNAANFQVTSPDYLYHAHDALLEPGDNDYMWWGWFNANSPATAGAFNILAKASGTLGSSYVLDWFDPAGGGTHRLRYYINGATSGEIVFTADALGATTWYFFIASYTASSDELALWVNGDSPVTATAPAPQGTGTAQFRIGASAVSGDERYYDRWVDEVGFAMHAATSGDRDYLYNSGAGKSCASILSDSAPPGTARNLLLMGVGK